MRATRSMILILSLLLSAASGDASVSRYRGVSKRKNSLSYHCEVTFLGSSPRMKIWVGTYPSDALAALACDVVFYYTGTPSDQFNLEYSEDAVSQFCKPRSAYENLNNWGARKRFIKAQANSLISSIFSPDWANVGAGEDDVAVSPLVSERQRLGEVALAIVDHFRNQPERLREFMAWLMQHLSNAGTPSTTKEHAQTSSQQQREAQVLNVDDALSLDERVTLLLVRSLQGRPGLKLLLDLTIGSLPLFFLMFRLQTQGNAGNIFKVATGTERHQSRALSAATKKHKVNHSSIQLAVSDLFTAINFSVRNKAWQCSGYDLYSRTWLPPLSYLPLPDPELNISQLSVCGHGGLMCANVSKMPNKGELVVFNPLSGKKRALPPLLFSTNPVLMHMLVDSAIKSYKVIVAGSSCASDEHLSKKMEVFDSQTSKWEEMCDLPGPAFGLNLYQTGVCVNGILYFISFLDDNGCKGVVAFDVENGKWLQNMTCPIPISTSLDILQLVENNGEVCLFFEYSPCSFSHVEHRIDVLEMISDTSSIAGAVSTCYWRNVVRVKRDRRGLSVYPEYTCVGFGKEKLCIFNTINDEGVVYDMQDGRQSEVLEPPPWDRKFCEKLFTLNPIGFTLQPSFDSDPTPPSNADEIPVEETLLIHPFLQ